MIHSKEQAHDGSKLVKTGKDGRVYFSTAQQQKMLELFSRSGMSGKAFAASHGLNYSSFARWRRQERASQESRSSGNGFVLAELQGQRPPENEQSLESGLSLVLPCGAEVRAQGSGSVDLLARLIQRLR